MLLSERSRKMAHGWTQCVTGGRKNLFPRMLAVKNAVPGRNVLFARIFLRHLGTHWFHGILVILDGGIQLLVKFGCADQAIQKERSQLWLWSCWQEYEIKKQEKRLDLSFLFHNKAGISVVWEGETFFQKSTARICFFRFWQFLFVIIYQNLTRFYPTLYESYGSCLE